MTYTFRHTRKNADVLFGSRIIAFRNYEYKTTDKEEAAQIIAHPSHGVSILSDYRLTPMGIRTIFSNDPDKDMEIFIKKHGQKMVEDTTIIIGTHNQAGRLDNCLSSLFACTTPGFHLIISLNEASMEVRKVVDKYYKFGEGRTTLIYTGNPPYSKWANQAVSEAKTKYIVHLNDDTILRRYWLEGMLQLMHSKKKAKMITLASIGKDSQQKENWGATIGGYGMENQIIGFCAMMRKVDAKWSEEYQTSYMDFEKCNEIRSKGGEIWVDRRFPIIHLGGETRKTIKGDNDLIAKDRQLYQTKWQDTIYI